VADDKKTQTNDKPAAPQITLRRVERHDLAETFVDTIDALFFDGQTMRIECGVTRVDPQVQGQALTGARVPACRLVLTPGAAVSLMNQMQQTAAALVKAGVLKQGDAPAGKA